MYIYIYIHTCMYTCVHVPIGIRIHIYIVIIYIYIYVSVCDSWSGSQKTLIPSRRPLAAYERIGSRPRDVAPRRKRISGALRCQAFGPKPGHPNGTYRAPLKGILINGYRYGCRYGYLLL